MKETEIQEQLKNIFEQTYKEYKEYETYVKEKAPEIKKDRENLSEYLLHTQDSEEQIAENIFEAIQHTSFLQNDLLKLQTRLHNQYEIVKEIVEIPAEIKQEIQSLPKTEQTYTVKNGELTMLDEVKFKAVKEEILKNYKSGMAGILKSVAGN